MRGCKICTMKPWTGRYGYAEEMKISINDTLKTTESSLREQHLYSTTPQKSSVRKGISAKECKDQDSI